MKHCFINLSFFFFLFSFFENIISLSFYAKVCIKKNFPLKTTRLDLSHIHCYDHILRDFRKPWPSCPFRITPCWNLWATGRNMCVQVTRPHFLSKKKKNYTTTLNCYTFFFWYNWIVILYYSQIFKKKHITKMNLFLQRINYRQMYLFLQKVCIIKLNSLQVKE